jgi:hypothetical protein
MSSGEDCLFIGQPFVSSFIEIGSEEIVADDNPGCHKPDDSSQVAVSSFADSALSCVFARFIR